MAISSSIAAIHSGQSSRAMRKLLGGVSIPIKGQREGRATISICKPMVTCVSTAKIRKALCGVLQKLIKIGDQTVDSWSSTTTGGSILGVLSPSVRQGRATAIQSGRAFNTY